MVMVFPLQLRLNFLLLFFGRRQNVFKMSKMGNLSINLVTTISGDAEKTKINQETPKIGKKKVLQ